MKMLIYSLSLENRNLGSGSKFTLLIFRWGFNLMSYNNDDVITMFMIIMTMTTIAFDVLSSSVSHAAVSPSEDDSFSCTHLLLEYLSACIFYIL